MVHWGARLPYTTEKDPATQSTMQTPAIARKNRARRFSVHICKNVPIIYPSPLGPAEQLERFTKSEDITALLFEVAVEISHHGNLRDEVERRVVPEVQHDAG